MNQKSKSIVLLLSFKVILILICAFIIGIFFLNPFTYGKGLLLGGIFTVLKIQLLHTTIKKSVLKAPHAAINYARTHYVLRYILTILVVIIGVLEPSINVVGVIVGLLSMKIAAFWQGLSEKPTPKDGSVTFLEWEDEDEEESSDF